MQELFLDVSTHSPALRALIVAMAAAALLFIALWLPGIR
jgi:hypothetical protein